MTLRTLTALALATAVLLLGSACDDCRLRFLEVTLPEAVMGQDYYAELAVNCEFDEVVALQGALPPGMQLSARRRSVEIMGRPMVAGDYTILVEVVRHTTQSWDGDVEPGSRATANLFLRVLDPADFDGPASPDPGGGGIRDAGGDPDATPDPADSPDPGDTIE